MVPWNLLFNPAYWNYWQLQFCIKIVTKLNFENTHTVHNKANKCLFVSQITLVWCFQSSIVFEAENHCKIIPLLRIWTVCFICLFGEIPEIVKLYDRREAWLAKLFYWENQVWSLMFILTQQFICKSTTPVLNVYIQLVRCFSFPKMYTFFI